MDLDTLIKALMQIREVAGENIEVCIDVYEHDEFIPITNAILLRRQGGDESKACLTTFFNLASIEKMNNELKAMASDRTKYGRDPGFNH